LNNLLLPDMANLQKTNLGVAPDGAGGDDARTAFSKGNANVDVLNAQVALTSAHTVTSAQQLTAVHIGKRVNISLAAPGLVNLPAASTCAADQVTLLRNLGPSVVSLAHAAGSDDTVLISALNVGETVVMDTDGVHTWSGLMRGRTNNDNETVNGNLTVGSYLLAVGKVGGVNAAQLLVNSTGELGGTVGWNSTGTQALALNPGAYAEGPFWSVNSALTGSAAVAGPDVSNSFALAEGVPFVLQAELNTQGLSAGQLAVDVEYLDSAGALISGGPRLSVPRGLGWTFAWVKGVTPAKTASVHVRKFLDGSPVCTAYGANVRRIKVCAGTTPDLYSQEASPGHD
jgi:hypothetical protein